MYICHYKLLVGYNRRELPECIYLGNLNCSKVFQIRGPHDAVGSSKTPHSTAMRSTNNPVTSTVCRGNTGSRREEERSVLPATWLCSGFFVSESSETLNARPKSVSSPVSAKSSGGKNFGFAITGVSGDNSAPVLDVNKLFGVFLKGFGLADCTGFALLSGIGLCRRQAGGRGTAGTLLLKAE